MTFDPANCEDDAVPRGICADCLSPGARFRPDHDRSLCDSCHRECDWYAEGARRSRRSAASAER